MHNHFIMHYQYLLLIIMHFCSFDFRINKPFTCSRCFIRVSCSVHVISTYYVRKGSWLVCLNYPQIKEVRKSDHVVYNFKSDQLEFSLSVSHQIYHTV